MLASTAIDRTDPRALRDEDVVARVLAGCRTSFEVLMRRYNQRLYRAARAVLRDDAEAEDVVQDSWVRAYTHLDQFAGRSSFATWVTRIAIHEALARARRAARHVALGEHAARLPARTPSPDEELRARQAAQALEAAIDGLPAPFRAVFMLRELEGLDTAETAACLELPEATVKTRLHRARVLLRARLEGVFAGVAGRSFAFAGDRCDGIVAAVLSRIGELDVRSPGAG